MSVINKMLKDLDKRQQPHGIESMAAPQMAASVKTFSKKSLFLACSLSLIFGGVAVFFVSNLTQSKDAAGALVASNIVSESPVGPQPVTKVDVQSKPAGAENQASVAAEDKPIKSSNTAERAAEVTVEPQLIATSNSLATESVNTADVDIDSTAIEQLDTKPESVPQKPVVVTNQAPKAERTLVAELADKAPSISRRESESTLNISHTTKRSNELHSSSNMAVTEVKLSPEQLAQKQMQMAMDAQQQGLHSEALNYYEAALAYYPAQHKARRQAAALYYGQNKLAKAADLLEQGRLLFPQQYEFSLLLARVLQASGQNDQALLSLDAIPDTSDFAIKKWHQQSDLAQKQKDYPVAEKSFRQLAQQEPNQGRWWMGLGYALDAQQKYGDAKLAYHQALLQDNLSAQAKVYVDNRLLQLGAY
ncbi:tetratricopeptide repeat protein [Shewanella marinintestina]|uniref:tetratricopeptide repeat protein n=1 Tax=Shewanella marinintestina TaxID=190305 RepID=UPI00200C2D48|nr:tetratricopeptide repeat protein [Shewanella marinintestina]MCL1146456.1 tetratricopeptide repeat protein [Shewanella marinintestina]